MTDKLTALSAPEFVSYSANAEDVLLRRLFPGPEVGFYVDVGAGHPIWESDTKALRDRGWRGINIEPQKDFLAELRRERPDDVNLGVALSDAPGERAFFEVENTGLSTLDKHYAARAEAAGHRVKSRTVPVLTLAQVLVENNAPSAFEFLKVDVEGLEQAVLAGNDWLRFRPHVVMIEVTVPETPIRREDGCRALLIGVGWRHAWFDGLNDWYLAPDFAPPSGAFDAPPNIFDRYVTRRTAEAEAAVRALEAENARLAEVNPDLAKQNIALSQVQNDLASTRQQVADARAESNHFREVMMQAQAQSAAYKADNARLRGRLADVNAGLPKHNTALSQVQNDLASARQEVADARAESTHFREVMMQVHAQSAALEAESARLRVRLADVNADLAKHNKALAQAQNDLVSTRQEVADARAESNHFREVMNALRATTSWRLYVVVRELGRILRRR